MKKIILSFTAGLILATSTSVIADTVKEMIEVSVAPNDIYVNDTLIDTDSFLYNDTTYVPMRSITEAMDAEVLYDGDINRIDINTNDTANTADNSTNTNTSTTNTDSSMVSDTSTLDGYTLTISNTSPKQNSDITINVDGDGGTYAGEIEYKSTTTEIPVTAVGTSYTFSIGRASVDYKTPITVKVTKEDGEVITLENHFTPID